MEVLGASVKMLRIKSRANDKTKQLSVTRRTASGLQLAALDCKGRMRGGVLCRRKKACGRLSLSAMVAARRVSQRVCLGNWWESNVALVSVFGLALARSFGRWK